MKYDCYKEWCELDICGNVILDKFIPFKTPLNYSNRSDRSQVTLSPELLMSYFEIKKVKIGMVIDLTCTDKYYNKKNFEKHGIKHVKFSIMGYKDPPTRRNVINFNRICNDFWAREPNSVIGVHCTHGLNRTGFLICSFLVEQMELNIDDAISLFRQNRPPGIKKQFYIDELKNRYNTHTYDGSNNELIN